MRHQDQRDGFLPTNSPINAWRTPQSRRGCLAADLSATPVFDIVHDGHYDWWLREGMKDTVLNFADDTP